MPASREPHLDGLWLGHVAPPPLPLRLARPAPHLVALSDVLDDQLTDPTGAATAVAQHGEPPTESASERSAQ
jgi:hypothetical protein